MNWGWETIIGQVSEQRMLNQSRLRQTPVQCALVVVGKPIAF